MHGDVWTQMQMKSCCPTRCVSRSMSIRAPQLPRDDILLPLLRNILNRSQSRQFAVVSEVGINSRVVLLWSGECSLFFSSARWSACVPRAVWVPSFRGISFAVPTNVSQESRAHGRAVLAPTQRSPEHTHRTAEEATLFPVLPVPDQKWMRYPDTRTSCPALAAPF